MTRFSSKKDQLREYHLHLTEIHLMKGTKEAKKEEKNFIYPGQEKIVPVCAQTNNLQVKILLQE